MVFKQLDTHTHTHTNLDTDYTIHTKKLKIDNRPRCKTQTIKFLQDNKQCCYNVTKYLSKPIRYTWIARRSNQSVLKEINFGHLMQRDASLEKTLMLGKTGGRRRGDRG